MKKYGFLLASSVLVLASCSTPKTYFTPAIRSRVEGDGVPLTKLQYYIDRNVVLTREVVKGETKVTSGTVRFLDGKYVNVITLKKNTPGVCTMNPPNKLEISFEVGDGKNLTFGKTRYANTDDPYKILANDWVGNYGKIMYEGKQYYIRSGTDASIMIKTSELKKSEVKKREMKGRTI